MKKFLILLSSLSLMFVLISCPTGATNSQTSTDENDNPTLLSDDLSNPQSLVLDREYAFKLSFGDIFGEVAILHVALNDESLKISGREVTKLSGTEYSLGSLSAVQSGAIERYANVVLRLGSPSVSVVSLSVTAYRDYDMSEQVGSSAVFYVKEASKPQDIRLNEMFVRYSNDSANPTNFTTQALHSMGLKVTDAARWVQAAKVTISDPSLILKGKNISGSSGEYFIRNFKLYENIFSIAYFQLQAASGVTDFNISIELLEENDQSFTPAIGETFYLKGDENPSQLFAVYENKELGDNSSPTKIYQQMTLNFSFIDPAEKVGSVSTSSTNFSIETVNSGGTLVADTIASLAAANDLGRRALEIVIKTVSGATNAVEKFSFELLDSTGSSFSPQLKKEYYLQKATIPSSLKLEYKGSAVSETSGAATLIELKETLNFSFDDPDQLVDSIRLKINNTDFELGGEKVWLDKSGSSENEYFIQEPIVSSGAGKDLVIEKGSKNATLNFELKLRNNLSFNPSITRNYYVNIN